MKSRGFTVIELVVAVVALIAIGAVAWQQIGTLEKMRRDDTRRTAINAMYYNLEEVYFPKNKSYPKSISEKNLTAMDESLFTDPNGKKIGNGESEYRYQPLNCEGNACKAYTLRAVLENEAEYIKENREQ